MKKLLIVLAFILGSSANFADDARRVLLDTPIRVASEDDAFEAMKRLSEALHPDDRDAFSESVTYFHVHFSRHISPQLSKDERSDVFVTALDGLTPRQVIIFGMVLRQGLRGLPDPYADTLPEDERSRRQEHAEKHWLGHEYRTVGVLRHYKKEANSERSASP
jgi:hypothetical protein